MVGLAMLIVASEARAREFGGYDCSDNCSGHAAGYRWAEGTAFPRKRTVRCEAVPYHFTKGAWLTWKIRTEALMRTTTGMTSTIEWRR
jgi:hypothetical protein